MFLIINRQTAACITCIGAEWLMTYSLTRTQITCQSWVFNLHRVKHLVKQIIVPKAHRSNFLILTDGCWVMCWKVLSPNSDQRISVILHDCKLFSLIWFNLWHTSQICQFFHVCLVIWVSWWHQCCRNLRVQWFTLHLQYTLVTLFPHVPCHGVLIVSLAMWSLFRWTHNQWGMY